MAHLIAASLTDSETSAYALEVDSDMSAEHPAHRWALLMSGGLNARLRRFDAGCLHEAILAPRNQNRTVLPRCFALRRMPASRGSTSRLTPSVLGSM
ncbi:MAG: hypothetical protein IT184_02595 [Acidobacteria bacterium]|nr:hypothetical protein [Acidobacteriota bacterium]